MADSAIEWTNATWNPTRGCERVSQGCMRCYAEQFAGRFAAEGQPYHELVKRVGGEWRWTGKVRMVPEQLEYPLRMKAPRTIFVDSMSDLFHDDVTDEYIAAVFGVMAVTPQHTYQILTKRPERARRWFQWMAQSPDPVQACVDFAAIHGDQHGLGIGRMFPGPRAWPLPNVWLGVSIEDQETADERVPVLLDIDVALRFLSYEPALGPVRLVFHGSQVDGWDEDVCVNALTGEQWTSPRAEDEDVVKGARIGWVIAGCESGRGARPAEDGWFRSMRDQCAAAETPFFLKQAKESISHGRHGFDANPDGVIDEPITLGSGSRRKKGVISLPYLDGVQHTAMPTVRS